MIALGLPNTPCGSVEDDVLGRLGLARARRGRSWSSGRGGRRPASRSVVVANDSIASGLRRRGEGQRRARAASEAPRSARRAGHRPPPSPAPAARLWCLLLLVLAVLLDALAVLLDEALLALDRRRRDWPPRALEGPESRCGGAALGARRRGTRRRPRTAAAAGSRRSRLRRGRRRSSSRCRCGRSATRVSRVKK